jgi:hypothetical protein
MKTELAKKNLAYTLGYTNLGFPLKELNKAAKSGASGYATSVVYTLPYEEGIDMSEELRAWLKPSYFSQIKLPLPKLKEYVKKTFDDVYDFMEKNKLW